MIDSSTKSIPQFYTHISDQYAPFHTKVINVGVRDATYVLDGLLYHESDIRIEEHYTDTSGFIDHVFALMHLLGFRKPLPLNDPKVITAKKMHGDKSIKIEDICKTLRISRATLYRYLSMGKEENIERTAS